MAGSQTAVQYHFWHALGLLAVAMLMLQKPESGALAAAAWLLPPGSWPSAAVCTCWR